MTVSSLYVTTELKPLGGSDGYWFTVARPGKKEL